MQLYEQGGGHVNEIPTGLSGNDAAENSTSHTQRLFLEPSVKRTHVPEVIAAIEARRKDKLIHKPSTKSSRTSRRRRKTIYDDFGEALRTVWVEE